MTVVIIVALLGTVMCGPLPSRDVLAGQEFLAVYMRSHQPGNKRSSYFINNNLVHETTTIPTTYETTTIVDTTEMSPSQIVKVVGVSSSVVRQSGKPQEKSLVTIEEPTITAVQRTHFGVDESSGTLTIQGTPDSGFSIETRQDSESSRISVKQNHNVDSSSSFSIHRNIQPNLDKVEKRTSFSVGIKQETKTESLPIETFNTERPRRNWVRPDNLYSKHKEITQKDNPTNQPHAERLFSQPIQDTIRKERISYTVATEGAQLDNWSTDENVYDADIRKEKPKNYHYQGKKGHGDYRERDSRQYVPEQKNWEYSEKVYGQPEKNYEVDEAASIMSNGRINGVQNSATQNPNKFGYVVEGSDFRKYRVEEKTSDGFIVGEYGVVSHNDGSLRGVRYTADSNINPRLIYDTLVKFLSLK